MADDRTPPERLRGVQREPDQVPRLQQFRLAHPEVSVEFAGPYWRAVIPEPHGETVIVRYDLRRLLDKLESLDAADDGKPRQRGPRLSGPRGALPSRAPRVQRPGRGGGEQAEA